MFDIAWSSIGVVPLVRTAFPLPMSMSSAKRTGSMLCGPK
jgi:hypothetical protein